MTISASIPSVMLEKASDGLSVTQAANRLGVNRQTIRNWIKDGKLEATTFGGTMIRIAPADLDKLRQPASGHELDANVD